MARRVFYSFHFDADCWRTSMVRQIGAIEGNRVIHANDWHEVSRRGPEGIKRWISDQMDGRSCCVVLVGASTAHRPWVMHEIVTAWNRRMGVLGIRIHGLKDQRGQFSDAGPNPFDFAVIQDGPYMGSRLSRVVKLHEPAGWDSRAIYGSIASGLPGWIDEAIAMRALVAGS